MDEMNKIIYGCSLVMMVLLLGCRAENMDDCFTSTGKIVTTERFIPSYHSLEISDHIDVYITYGTEQSIQVKAGENLLQHIETNVKNGVLEISNENRCNWVRSFKKKVEVFITTNVLREIKIYGSGEIVFTNELKSDQLLVNLFDASGNIFLNVNAPLVELKTHTGTGSIYTQGSCDELVLFMGANGIIDAFALKSDKALAVNENTGLLRVNALNELKAVISGSGNIEYTGSPSIELNQRRTGRLVKKE